jgi:integrase
LAVADDSGRVFTHPDGRALNPDGVSQRFERLITRYNTIRREHAERGWTVDQLSARHSMPPASIEIALERGPLPPIRLHDLRHTAASLTYRATRDFKVVSELLGHASIQFTGDVYTTLFEDADREAAEAAARIVPRTHRPPGWADIQQTGDGGPSLPEPSGPEPGL